MKRNSTNLALKILIDSSNDVSSESPVTPIQTLKRTSNHEDSPTVPKYDPIETFRPRNSPSHRRSNAPALGDENAQLAFYFRKNHCHYRMQKRLGEMIDKLTDLSESKLVQSDIFISTKLAYLHSDLENLHQRSIDRNDETLQSLVNLNSNESFCSYKDKHQIKFESEDINDDSIPEFDDINLSQEYSAIKKAETFAKETKKFINESAIEDSDHDPINSIIRRLA